MIGFLNAGLAHPGHSFLEGIELDSMLHPPRRNLEWHADVTWLSWSVFSDSLLFLGEETRSRRSCDSAPTNFHPMPPRHQLTQVFRPEAFPSTSICPPRRGCLHASGISMQSIYICEISVWYIHPSDLVYLNADFPCVIPYSLLSPSLCLHFLQNSLNYVYKGFLFTTVHQLILWIAG